jgi:RNA 3'-terminal phosphate cyclase (ATP)
LGSSSITFTPGHIHGGKYFFEIGTAGSITLVLQACILPSLFADTTVTVALTGGTDVKWAPPWDYFNHVFLHHLRNMNIEIEASCIKRGYYPKGGGKAEVVINPCKKLRPITLNETDVSQIIGTVTTAGLPVHISKRIQRSVLNELKESSMEAEIRVAEEEALSPGVGAVLWTNNKSILGADCLGERGVSAEIVGKTAAAQLLKEINSGATVDAHAVDQLIPYMALTHKNIFRCRKISRHAETGMWLINKFFELDIKIEQKNAIYQVAVG